MTSLERMEKDKRIATHTGLKKNHLQNFTKILTLKSKKICKIPAFCHLNVFAFLAKAVCDRKSCR